MTVLLCFGTTVYPCTSVHFCMRALLKNQALTKRCTEIARLYGVNMIYQTILQNVTILMIVIFDG